MLGIASMLLEKAGSLAELLDLRKLAQGSHGRQISAGEFRQLMEQLMEKRALTGASAIKTQACGENNSARAGARLDAGDYLLAKSRMTDTLAPALFQSLDQNGNGMLEGEELGKLDDVLTHLNRELLLRGRSGQLDKVFSELTEIIEEAPEA